MRSLQEYTTQKFDERIDEGLLDWLKKLFRFTWKSIKKINAYIKDDKFPVKGSLQEFHIAKIITSNNIYDFYKSYFKRIHDIKNHLPATNEILDKIDKYIDEDNDIIDLSSKKISSFEIWYDHTDGSKIDKYFCGIFCYMNDIEFNNTKYKSLIIAYEIDQKVITNWDEIRDDLFKKILGGYNNKIGKVDKQEILFLYNDDLYGYDYFYPSHDLYYNQLVDNLYVIKTENSNSKKSDSSEKQSDKSSEKSQNKQSNDSYKTIKVKKSKSKKLNRKRK